MNRIPSTALSIALLVSGAATAQELLPPPEGFEPPALQADDRTPPVDEFATPTDEPVWKVDEPAGPVEELVPPNNLSSAPTGDTEPEVEGAEMIRERYPDGTVKIERYVIQDDQQNYMNHGSWKMWDEERNLVCQGQYRFGQRHGLWRRMYFSRDEAPLLESRPYSEFTLPYASSAEFIDGRLTGIWEMQDSQNRTIFRWEFLDGRRHGKSTWWYPNGQPMRELTYEDGTLNGELLEWDVDGNLVTQDRFEQGRRLVKRTERYPSGQPRAEGFLLYPRLVLKTPDDWWTCRLAKYEQEGKYEKHGEWTSWYENGQKKMAGQFRHDQPFGNVVWWHPNGQKALEGQYGERGEKHGRWTWWHENGQKSIQGEYLAGTAHGPWTWWNEDGKVARRSDFTPSGQRGVAGPVRGRLPAELPQQSRRGAARWPWSLRP